MKKVLIITYYWPPSGGAGVQRWLKFVKYMHHFGWQPVVYTAEGGEMPVIDKSLLREVPEGTTVIKRPIWEPYSLYKQFTGRKKEDKVNASFLNEGRKEGWTQRASVWIRGNLFIPDARRFWIKPSINYLEKYLRREKIDMVISSGPPHSMHLIALGLKKRIPTLKWVADFRDPWTQIDFYDKLMLTGAADRLHKKQELSVLGEADLVISIGRTMSQQLEEILIRAGGRPDNRFRVVTNGYDEEDLPGTAPQKHSKFSLAHIGTLVKDRNPDELWQALSELVMSEPGFAERLEIRLVGKVDVFVKERIQSFGLEKYVVLIPYLPHDEVITEQQRASLLLLLVNKTPNAKGILTGKFFEYLSSGVPVLAIGPEDGDLAEILHECSAGRISDFGDVATLKKNILELAKPGAVLRNEAAIQSYSRKNLTGQLCRMLDELS